MPSTRIAIVGSGLIGQRHLKVLLENTAYSAAAIADPAPAAAALATQHGVPHFSDYQRMLDEARPDGVIVATPNALHVSVGLACVARGIPMLVEKPLADSIASARQLVDAARAANVPLLTGHHRRHNPIMAAAAKAIQSGAVGRVTAVNAMWLNHKPDDYFDIAWRRQLGAGTVLINGIHDIDCLRMLCGEIESVQAFAEHGVRKLPVEDTAAAAIRFASGALGTFIVSDTVSTPWSWEWGSYENAFYPHESQNCYVITGTRGSLTVPSLEHWWHEPGQSWGDSLSRRRIPYTPEDAYVAQMRNFAEVIAGTAVPVMNGEEGLRTLASTLAISISAQTGRTVHVDELLRQI
jgi:predicted dehydrogenase